MVLDFKVNNEIGCRETINFFIYTPTLNLNPYPIAESYIWIVRLLHFLTDTYKKSTALIIQDDREKSDGTPMGSRTPIEGTGILYSIH